MDIFKFMGLALLTVILSGIVKEYKREFSIYIVIASGLIFFLGVSFYTKDVFSYVESLCDRVGIDKSYLKILIKVIGVSYITEFTSSVCKDAGETSVSLKVDIIGKLVVLCASLPLLQEVLDTIFKLG